MLSCIKAFNYFFVLLYRPGDTDERRGEHFDSGGHTQSSEFDENEAGPSKSVEDDHYKYVLGYCTFSY